MPALHILRPLRRWLDGVGLRGRLLLLVLAMGLPFLGYLTIASVLQVRADRQFTHRLVTNAAQFTASRLDDHLGNLRALITTLATASSTGADAAAHNDALLRTLMPDLAGRVHAVTLWSADGRNLGSSSAGTAPAWRDEDRALVRKAAASEGGLAVQTRTTSPDGALAVFGQVVRRPGQPVFYLLASIQLEQYHRRLVDPQQRLPEGTVVTVMDADGIVLARSIDAQRWIGRPTGATPARVAELRRQAPGTHQATSLEGQQRILGFAATRTMPLLVWVGIPVDVALAPAHDRLLLNVALGVAMLALAVATAAWVGGAIAGPLRQLNQDAARLGDGDLTHRNRVSGMPEVGRLARTLNDMADALQARTRSQQQTEAMLREITDNMPALISLVDQRGRFLFTNAQHAQWFGPDNGPLGRTLLDISERQGVDSARHHFRAAYGGQRVEFEHCARSIAGLRWLHVTLIPRFDAGRVTGLYIMSVDITERRDAQKRLALSEQRLSMALEASSLALFDWDVPGRRMYYSMQSSVMRGGPPTETVVTDRERLDAVHPEDMPILLGAIGAALKGEISVFRIEYRLRNLGGDWIWILSRGQVVERDAQGRALRVTGTDANITERKRAEQRLRQLAEHDPLTGLPNRALFMDRLQQAVARARRHERLLAVMFLDIDHFKQINDTLGHAAGDRILVAQAHRLAARVRQADTVARLSGDEFTVILEDLHDVAGAHALAGELVQAAREPVMSRSGLVQTTISVGLAFWSPDDAADGSSLLRRADSALYEAKRRGRDQYMAESPSDAGLTVNGLLF